MHFWRDLLEELEFFDHQVVVVEEGLVDVLFDIIVQVRLNVKRLVGFLDLFDPHVELVELLVDEVFEVVRGVEDAVDATHEEGEEDKPDELESDREKELVGSFTRVVAIADRGNNLENPIESKDILSVLRLVRESVGSLPVVDPAALAAVPGVLDSAAILLMSEVQPEARVDMICVYDTEYQAGEDSQIALPLLAQILQHELQNELLWLCQSVNVEDTKHF